MVIEIPVDERDDLPNSASSSNSQQKTASISSVFESQLYLFEAVGKLISYESDTAKQCEYLSVGRLN